MEHLDYKIMIDFYMINQLYIISNQEKNFIPYHKTLNKLVVHMMNIKENINKSILRISQNVLPKFLNYKIVCPQEIKIQLKKYVICSKDEQISLITHDLDTLLHKFQHNNIENIQHLLNILLNLEDH
ncbi:hypothetical protein pb186bvf_020931 [Paramecium bursaria]